MRAWLCGYDGAQFFHVPGIKVNATDAVGCGDTVRATLALGVALNPDLYNAAVLANYAAAVIVQKSLTASLTKEELLLLIKKCNQ